MRYDIKRKRKVYLQDFIVDTITDIPGLPEDMSIADIETIAEKIINEVILHIQYGLENTDTDEIVQ